MDQAVAAIGRGARREHDLFRLAGTRSQGKLIGGLGSRAAIAIGCLFLVLIALPGGHGTAVWLLVGAGVFALSTGLVLVRLPVAAPLPVLDFLLVVADVLLVFVGHYPSPIVPALPGIYVIVGTILFSVRTWRVVVAHAALLGASYAGVLAFGPPTFAPVTRWLCMMTAVATTGLFVRWLVATVAGLAFAEHAARDIAEGAASELERVSQAKTAFLARMSHELRTPLNVVLGFSDLLGEQLVGPLSPRQAEYAADISASARHLVALVGDVLDVAKIETGAVVLETGPLNVKRAIEDGITMVRERAAANGQTLTRDIARNLGTIEADGLKIRQVIVNLLANAVKFTPPGGRIVVSAQPVEDRVLISVADTGPGIPPEDMDRIFEEFAQSSNTGEGTGLGLALARQFVTLHGGTLGVDSTPGAGSTFFFDLPRRRTTRTVSGQSGRDEGDESEPDYSAFTEPGSAANQALLGRIGGWLTLDGSLVAALVGAISPLPTTSRILLVTVGLTVAALMLYARRFDGRPLSHVEYVTWAGIAAISFFTYYAGPFRDLLPLVYGWSSMVSFALWPRSRAVAHYVGVGVCYGVVQLLLWQHGGLSQWAAIMIIVGFNGEIVSWVTNQLRGLVVAEQTAHRRAERARSQLAATSRHKGWFVTNMSHELRTPLNAIIGFADLLQAEAVGPLNSVQHEYLNDIQVSGRHLLAIINDVLDVAKLDANQMQITPAVVAIQALLERAINLSQPVDTTRAVRIELRVAPEADFIVADHHRLEQIMINLISNAVKFTPDGGQVCVAAQSTEGGELRITVSDTGVGIVPSQRRRIFEPFHQGAPVPGVNLHEGTGLGLALVKGLVELHGGRVWVNSEAGHGATFTVALPQLAVPADDLLPVGEAQP